MTDVASEKLTYGSYLHVPELLELQRPRRVPQVHGEMLFIVVQQAQELWFKQVLHELRLVTDLLVSGEVPEATHVLDRVDRILCVLSQQIEILEGLPPAEFQEFRDVLKTASGFESEQFRELELASGLGNETFLQMVSHLVDLEAIHNRWPITLHEAFLQVISRVASDPVEALTMMYRHPSEFPDEYRLAEALSDYEMRFVEWRFHHLELVNRIIGDRSPGSGGSPGGAYLIKTLDYRFFPELWEARNRLTERSGQVAESQRA